MTWDYDLSPEGELTCLLTFTLGVAVEQTATVNDDGTVTHRYVFAPTRSDER